MSKRKWDEPAGPASASASPAPNQDALDAAAKIAAKIADQYGEGSARKTPAADEFDPPFVKDVDINDLRNRYMLTKGSTQAEIHENTKATVTTRGSWYPDKTMATEKDPSLHLHITALSQEALDAGVAAVNQLMEQELGSLTVRPEYLERPNRDRERRRWPEHKVIIGLDNLRNFNVRAKVVGPGGLFVKYIQQETNTRVQIKGQGSGFIEPETGREGEDPMHINIAGPDEHMLNRAKELAEDLLTVVTEKWHETTQFNSQHQGGGASSGPASMNLNYYTSVGSAPLPAGQAPPMPGQSPASQPSAPAQQTPEQAAYWAQINSNPEWANYYHQLFQQYGYAGVPAGYIPPGQQPATPAPPPPPSAPAPAPPPPSDGARRQGSGAYGAVAPPAGL